MNDKVFLIICTVRYCLGRQSYAVGWIRDILLKEWDNIPKNDRMVILKDIKSFTEKNFTMLNEWNEILDLGVRDKLIII